MWNSFNTYGLSHQDAFETLCNQLFEKFLIRTYNTELRDFKVINGSGGDGGIEACGKLNNNNIVAIQSKWFRNSLNGSQVDQIKKSIVTALKLRPNIIEYIICVPRNINSTKIGSGQKPIKNTEEHRLKELVDLIKKEYPKLSIIWWFEHQILNEIQQEDNEGVHKYWFEKEVFGFTLLDEKFQLQKTNNWLKERYVSELHSKGVIQKQIDKITYSQSFRKQIIKELVQIEDDLSESLFLFNHFISITGKENYIEKLKQICVYLNNIKTEIYELKVSLKNASQINLKIKNEEVIPEINLLEELIEDVRKTNPSNIQKVVYDKFLLKLREISHDIIHKYFKIQDKLSLIVSTIFFGRPGTGKTLGLAYAVEDHLKENCPAILIRAKGASSSNWTKLLSDELELPLWNKHELFSALETLALKNDIRKTRVLKVGEEQNFEKSSVLISIDGLEEDVLNEKDWYDRISESTKFFKRYPRIKFVFSARNYFYNNEKIPNSELFEEIRLGREGDVRISDISEKYFKNYNIKIHDYSLIKGLDSLLSLKLFCEEYANKEFNSSDIIETAKDKLILKKLNRLNIEFLDSLDKRKSKSLNPVIDCLKHISDLFYQNPELVHDNIINKIAPILHYLDGSEIELLLEYLSDNGILIKYERKENTPNILAKTLIYYTYSYQSILEIIITDNISRNIINEKDTEIPNLLFQHIALPLDHEDNYNTTPPNQQIIQNIVNKVFIEKGKLVGENNFLINGFTDDEIFSMQLEALLNAPYELAVKYKEWIDNLFMSDYFKRSHILQDLILPSAHKKDSPFNAMYLHDILMAIPNAFERDKFWSDLDSYEKNNLFSDIPNYQIQQWSVSSILHDNFELNEFDLHNELPLIYVWGLSSINQKLREHLRVKLTKWAILIPKEFLKLLELLFNCNDPQIQEDLASITLGVASKSKNKESLEEIAKWSIKNVFGKLSENRNVVVRYGFKSIVERAYQFKLITKKDVEKIRNLRSKNFEFLKLDSTYLSNQKEEFYPIVHDLAWYVIKESYEDFLAYATSFNSLSVDKKTKETDAFIEKYRSKYNLKISNRTWAMSAAIAYIKQLGFDRKKGNGLTDATHGSKSKVFTYEEKYTWLAVNYIKGYLSDYLPYIDGDEKRWIEDYSLITPIHNPTEDFSIDIESQVDDFFNPPNWMINETLTPELSKKEEISEEIVRIVNTEPSLDFEKWLLFDGVSFGPSNTNKIGLAIYNNTTLSNSSKTIDSSITIQSHFASKEDLLKLIKLLSQDDELYIKKHSTDYLARPETDTYSNPSDIIWMDWINETGSIEYFSDNSVFYPSLARVVKRNIDSEKEIHIPSKKTRHLLDIVELDDDKLINSRNEVVGIIHEIFKKSYDDYQEIILLDKNKIQSSIEKHNLNMFWFASLFIHKNHLNESLNKDFHSQKFRKYLIWIDKNNEFKHLKFWDEKFSNQKG